MKPFPVPVVPFGPGSQPEDEPLNYLTMPKDMYTFSLPSSARILGTAGLGEARRALQRLLDAMNGWRFGSPGAPVIDLSRLSSDGMAQLNQSLGEGEVSVIIQGTERTAIQETVFASVWRVQELAEDGRIKSDRLEVGTVPAAVRTVHGQRIMQLPPEPAGLMNAPALVREIADKAGRFQPGMAAHIINLTLLPVTPQDLEYLAKVLGFGRISILSRGYGNCRITATGIDHVWWVQYFNSMDQLILNTLEVVDVPEVALAAREDFEDSCERLAEWLETLVED